MAKPLSIEASLQWTQQFVAREWRLLLPLALAFIALPQIAFSLLLPPKIAAALATMTPQTIMPLLATQAWLAPVAILIQLFAFWGGLAIVALALIPRISVGEAIMLALRRFPIFLGAAILVILGELLMATLAAVILQIARLSLVAQQSILVGVIFAISIVIWIRLIGMPAVVVASRAGPLASIRLAWHLSAGAFWRILGAALIYSIGGAVILLASTFALGSIFVLLGNAIGSPDLGVLLSTIYVYLARSLFWAGFYVLSVALYRQLGGSIRGG